MLIVTFKAGNKTQYLGVESCAYVDNDLIVTFYSGKTIKIDKASILTINFSKESINKADDINESR